MSADQPQDRFVTANGLRFHYRGSGDPEGAAVLILHSITGHGWEWDPLAGALAERFRVIALDQRGHGASAWAPDYAPDRMASDIAAIVHQLALGPVTIVGHSMGGINGYLYAASHPDAVAKLVIVDVGPESLTVLGDVLRVALGTWASAAFAEPEEAVGEWLASSPLAHEPEMRRYVLPNLQQGDDGNWRWRYDAAGLHSFLDGAPDAAAQWAALRQVACPTLVIRGAESEALSAHAAGRMIQELPRGRLIDIPGAGHDVHIDQPEALIAAVVGFLATAEG